MESKSTKRKATTKADTNGTSKAVIASRKSVRLESNALEKSQLNVDAHTALDALEYAADACEKFVATYPDVKKSVAKILKGSGIEQAGHGDYIPEAQDLFRFAAKAIRLVLGDIDSVPMLPARMGWIERFNQAIVDGSHLPAPNDRDVAELAKR